MIQFTPFELATRIKTRIERYNKHEMYNEKHYNVCTSPISLYYNDGNTLMNDEDLIKNYATEAELKLLIKTDENKWSNKGIVKQMKDIINQL